MGDRALTQFAERISAITRAGSIVTRVGGDEFAIIVPDISSLDDPTALARRIAVAVAEPFVLDNIPTKLGVCIGIAIAPQDGVDPELLVQHADRALYRAKAEGRSGIRYFEPDMNAHVERRIAIERELREALAANRIVPFYQPGAWHRSSEESRRLEEIPGVGPIVATALVAEVGDWKVFSSGRSLAAWIGLVPRQHSTGGKERLGRISKQGNRHLRWLLVAGAMAVIRYARQHGTKRPWLARLMDRRPIKVAAVAC